MVGSTSRVLRRVSCLALAAVAVAACGPKGGGGGGGGATDGEYAALRWIPADATYAVVTRRTEDAVRLLHDLTDATGILSGMSAKALGAKIEGELGFDLLDLSDLATQGVDPARGLGLWSRGVGPSIAVPLADPARFAAMLDEKRGRGAVVQVARAGAVEVFTWRPDREVAIHWAIVDDWFLAHLELAEEREAEGGWYADAAAARGAFAATEDFRAAREHGARRLEQPGLVGVARIPAIFASRLGGEMRACRDTIGQAGRIAVAATSDGKDTHGWIHVELPGGVDGVRALRLAAPAGWAAARENAPLQVEAGLDLRELGPRWAACLDENVTEDAVRAGLHGGRAFAHALDVEQMEVKGAIAVAGEARVFAELLDDIPGLGFLQKQRTVAGVTVHDVNLPVLPAFSYAISGANAVATAGLSIDALVAPGAAGDELGRLELRPNAWPAAHWDAALAPIIGRDEERGRVVRDLRAWDLGRVVVGLEDRAVTIELHGVRH